MDPYKILGIDQNATPDEIKRAYRQKAKKHHPDAGGDAWAFQMIQDAYDELTGNKKRQKNQSSRRKHHRRDDQERSRSDSDAQTGRQQPEQQKSPDNSSFDDSPYQGAGSSHYSQGQKTPNHSRNSHQRQTVGGSSKVWVFGVAGGLVILLAGWFGFEFVIRQIQMGARQVVESNVEAPAGTGVIDQPLRDQTIATQTEEREEEPDARPEAEVPSGIHEREETPPESGEESVSPDELAALSPGPQESKTQPDHANFPFDNDQAKIHQERWAEYLELPVEFQNSIGMKFRLIPPGEFEMGSPETESGRQAQELLHLVRLTKPYYIAETVTTQPQWTAVQRNQPWVTDNPTEDNDYPAAAISWTNAVQFCERLSALENLTYRLPTEAEWEYACRAGSTTAYYFGDSADELGNHGWFNGNSSEPGLRHNHRVSQKLPNPFGLFDVYGNIWEYCLDWYDEHYYQSSPHQNPPGPETGTHRVIRGGSWSHGSGALVCRSGYRTEVVPDAASGRQGFRVLLEIESVLGNADFPETGQSKLASVEESQIELDRSSFDASSPNWPTAMSFDAARFYQQDAAKRLEVPVELKNTSGIASDISFVLIPAGKFVMGSPRDEPGRANNSAIELRHFIEIKEDFYLSKTEITQGQWRRIMQSAPWKGKPNTKAGSTYPVSWVSWNDAISFCKRLSQKEGVTYRLPTEAEWEYACRAGSDSKYSFGDSDASLNEYAWFKDNSWDIGEQYAHRVGLKKPNAWGLLDMHGNVFEWCHDWYQNNYYDQSDVQSPQGATSGTHRVTRGGSCKHGFELLRSAYRGKLNPKTRNFNQGFRVVRGLPSR